MSGLDLRHLIFVLLVFTIVHEIRRGYFKGFSTYLKTANWKFLGIALAILFSCFLFIQIFDAYLHQTLMDLQSSSFQNFVISLGERLSKNTTIWLFLGGGYVIAYLLKQQRTCFIFFGALLSNACAAILTTLFKYTFLRARPYSEYGPHSFFNLDGLLKDTHAFQSFPSGDVSIVSGACMFFFFATSHKILRWIWLVPPILIALARVDAHKHWPSDVFFSIGISALSAYFFWKFKSYQIAGNKSI